MYIKIQKFYLHNVNQFFLTIYLLTQELVILMILQIFFNNFWQAHIKENMYCRYKQIKKKVLYKQDMIFLKQDMVMDLLYDIKSFSSIHLFYLMLQVSKVIIIKRLNFSFYFRLFSKKQGY
jgi:hypothetical protein